MARSEVCEGPTVRTARLVVRPLCESDRAEFIRAHGLSGEHLAPWSPLDAAERSPEEQFDDQLARCAAGLRDGTACRLVGEVVDGQGHGTARLAGVFNLNNIVRGVFQNAAAGWHVYADVLGRGLATEGVVGLLDLAFAPPPAGLGLHRVQANIIPRNVRSVRVAEKAGFRREGEAKGMLKIAGRWEDHVMFAKVAEEHGGE